MIAHDQLEAILRQYLTEAGLSSEQQDGLTQDFINNVNVARNIAAERVLNDVLEVLTNPDFVPYEKLTQIRHLL